MNTDNYRVPFTQFLRPDGMRRLIWIHFPEPEVITKAQMMIDGGYEFQCEELMNGICSFTILDKTKNQDVGIELCPNGPAVPETVKKLIMQFNGKERISER